MGDDELKAKADAVLDGFGHWTSNTREKCRDLSGDVMAVADRLLDLLAERGRHAKALDLLVVAGHLERDQWERAVAVVKGTEGAK